MATFRHEIYVARPPQAVFEAVADVRTHSQWQAGLRASEGEALDARYAGARGVEVRKILGRLVRFPYEITAYEPPGRWGFRALNGPVRPAAVLSFIAEGEGTRIESELTVPGLIGRLVGRVLLAQQRRNYARLKQLLEGNELPDARRIGRAMLAAQQAITADERRD